ncbi:hypothetical protein LSTR_LSTR003140 [Laodelphax striatellus]|uniref:Uncharacterized protein n=1 Tax=Laodelphax striatellus TaxID=195883 RepID=A0A482WVS1_LAOST|nr:hypothetical protein LSTR_LSTR003140 [Laodelphax striatellus]
MEDCCIIEDDDANDAGGANKGEGEKENADSEDEGKAEDQNVDFFWIDPTQSFLTDTKEICKMQVPKIPIVCNLQAEMAAFEESIGATQPKLSDSEEQRPLLNVPAQKTVPDTKDDDKQNDDRMPHPKNTLADRTHIDGNEKHQTSQLNPSAPEKLIKADVHKLVAANLEKEDKELENLNKNLMDIIGNFMSKVQGSGDSSSQALQTSGDSIDPLNTDTDLIPKPIDVLDSSVACPIEVHDDYHHLDPQDRPHYTNQSGIPEPQFIEYVTPAGATEALTDALLPGSTHSLYAQNPSKYHSQIPGQSADVYQQAFDPQGVPIYPYHGQVPPSVIPYSEQGTALVDPYSGQYVPNTLLPGYDVGADADHSPDHYSDNEEPSSAPCVGPPEPQANTETVKKPFMTAEEIRLHRKEYLRKKREEELKRTLSANPDPAPQPTSTTDKQHHSDPSNVAQSKFKPELSRIDQKPTSSKSNQPKGPISKFMIPKRNDKSKEGKESELNPTNPFAPNPKFFMKKSNASSTLEIKTKPDSNKLDKHFYNELKSKYEFKSKTHGSPICDNSISSTTDKDSPNPSKKKKLSSKFKESHKDDRYSKKVTDRQKLEKKKEVSSATLARKLLSSDEEDSVENKPKLDQKIHDKVSDGPKSSSVSQSNSSHSANVIEKYPFVTDHLSRKAISCKCFVKLVNIFWDEKKSMTIDEMNEKLPRLVKKELDLLRKNRILDEPANLEEGLPDFSSSGQEPGHPDSTLGKNTEIVIESKQDQEVDDVTKPIDDKAEDLLSQKDIGEALKCEIDVAGSLEKEGKTSSVSNTSNVSEGKECIPTDAEEKLKTSDNQEMQETSLKQIPKSTEEGISEASRTKVPCLIVDETTAIKETSTSLEDDALVKSNELDTSQEEKIPDCIDSSYKSKIEKKEEPNNEYEKESLESTSKSTIEREDGKEELHDECSKESDSQHQKKKKRKDSLKNAEEGAKEEPHIECSKESLSCDSQLQKKTKRKNSLENAQENKRKTSSGTINDSSSDARAELTRKDLDEIWNDGVSDGFEAEDHVFDHDDSDLEEKMSEKSCSNENLDKSNVEGNSNDSSKIVEKSSKIEEENSKVQEPGIPEKDLQELPVSENYKRDNADNKKETHASEISIEVEASDHKELSQSNVIIENKGKTEDDKKIPLSTNESSILAENKIESSKNITISPDQKSSMNCSVKVIDIFWKEKKSLSHEEFQTILPTLIEDIMRKLKISTKVQKINEKKSENKKKKKQKKDAEDEDKDKSYAPPLVTKGQKKFYEKDVKTHSNKFKDYKKKMEKESSENLRKKSGISREFISSSDSDDDIIKRKSVDGDKKSENEKQNLDEVIPVSRDKDSFKLQEKSDKHRHKKEKKKKRKKTHRERSRSTSDVRSEREDENPPLEKPVESDNSSDDEHISSKAKKASRLERREHKKKKRDERKEKKKKDDEFSKREFAPQSNPNTCNENELQIPDKHDNTVDICHVATDKEKVLENENKNDGRRQDSTSSSHSKKRKKKTEKSDQLSKKKKKICSSNPNSDDEKGDSTIQNLCNQETGKNIVEEVFSMEERTQIFSDSEEECTKTESPLILSVISDEIKNADSIKDTVSNIIDSLSIECSPKKKNCSSSIVADTDTKDSKDQSSHSETSNDNVVRAHLQLVVDEESSLSNSVGLEGIEKRPAPEEVQKDLAELDKKMEEIEKIVHNQLESAPILSAEQPSTTSKEIETNSFCFECILCKNTFSTDSAAHNYSEKVSAFCKPCYDNLYKERFDSWRQSLK